MAPAPTADQTGFRGKNTLSARNLLITAILAVVVLFLSYKVVLFVYTFTHPRLVRFPFYCEKLDSSMSKEQIRMVLGKEGLDVLVQVEKNQESWWVTTNKPVFSETNLLGGVTLIFRDDKYFSANEITFDGNSPLCTFP